jgi:hypothetical protein
MRVRAGRGMSRWGGRWGRSWSRSWSRWVPSSAEGKEAVSECLSLTLARALASASRRAAPTKLVIGSCKARQQGLEDTKQTLVRTTPHHGRRTQTAHRIDLAMLMRQDDGLDRDLAQVAHLARTEGGLGGPAGLEGAGVECAMKAVEEAPALEGGEGVGEDDEEDEAADERVDDRVARLAHACMLCVGGM